MLEGGLKTLVMCLKILFSSLKVCSKTFTDISPLKVLFVLFLNLSEHLAAIKCKKAKLSLFTRNQNS